VAIDVNRQLVDSSVFDMVNDTGGPLIPSIEDVQFESNLDKEMGPKIPSPGKGAVDQKSLDAGDIFQSTPGLEQLFDMGGNQTMEEVTPGGEVGPETGEQQDPSPDNDFWTGTQQDLSVIRDEVQNFVSTNWSGSDNGTGISTFMNNWGSNPGSNGLEEYFNAKFSDPNYILQNLGGIVGDWSLATEMDNGQFQFDAAEKWRRFVEWYHVWGVNNPYYQDMTADEYNEVGGPLEVYLSNPDIYGEDPNNWHFAPVPLEAGGYAGDTSHGSSWGMHTLYADLPDHLGYVGESISVFWNEVLNREDSIGEESQNPYAPDYWESVYSIPWSDVSTTADELVDAWMDGDWMEIYGPFVSNLAQEMGITVEDWMDEYGSYLEPYNPEIAQGLRSSLSEFKNEARVRVQGDLDEERMNMVKSGFTESYQNIEALNSLISDFDATVNIADADAEQDIDDYNDSWYAGFLDTMMELGELGAFEPDTWEDLLEQTGETGDIQEEAEDMPLIEESAKGTGFTRHYA